MLVIHPDECIDCGVCEPECPAEPSSPIRNPGSKKMAGTQLRVFEILAQHHGEAEGPADGKEWDGVKGKLKDFDPEPVPGIRSAICQHGAGDRLTLFGIFIAIA